ncbi:MAG TPA: MFS transporter [Patescibacteria group bacterium]|nr:MFS transporter [Patescibacteria group bacterium]
MIFKKHFSGLTKNTFLLTFTSLFADISTEMLYPILPIFLTQVLGAGGAVVGIVEGVAVAVQNIIQGASGALSDKMRKRKPIALFGYLLAALSKPFIGLSTSWWGVFAARSVDRLGTGIRSAPRDAMIANSADEKSRGRAFGLEGIGDNLGAFLGPLLAVALLSYFNVSIRNIFFFALIPGFLAVFMMLFVKEKADDLKAKSKLNVSLFKFPAQYWKYLAVIGVFGIGNISSSFMILQTRNIGIPLTGTILIYALFNLVAAFISYPAGALTDKMGRKGVLLFSFVLFFISLMGFASTKNFAVISLMFVLFGLYMGIFRAAGKAYASDFAPKEFRASAVGWYNTTVGFSGLIASILAGQIYDRIGHATVFATAAIFVFVGGALLLTLRQKRA